MDCHCPFYSVQVGVLNCSCPFSFAQVVVLDCCCPFSLAQAVVRKPLVVVIVAVTDAMVEVLVAKSAVEIPVVGHCQCGRCSALLALTASHTGVTHVSSVGVVISRPRWACQTRCHCWVRCR